MNQGRNAADFGLRIAELKAGVHSNRAGGSSAARLSLWRTRMTILAITDLSVLGFYGYIEY